MYIQKVIQNAQKIFLAIKCYIYENEILFSVFVVYHLVFLG